MAFCTALALVAGFGWRPAAGQLLERGVRTIIAGVLCLLAVLCVAMFVARSWERPE